MLSGNLPSAGTGVKGKLCRVELDQEKLAPLLRLKYHDSMADALVDLGRARLIPRQTVSSGLVSRGSAFEAPTFANRSLKGAVTTRPSGGDADGTPGSAIHATQTRQR